MTYPQPFFILGNPRSGTTLLRLILAAHTKLSVPPECGFLVWWYPKFKDWNVTASTNELCVEGYLKNLKTSRKIETWDLDYTALYNLIIASKPNNYAELSSLVYISYSLQQGKSISLWGDKNNHYLNYLETLHTLYPNAYFIHLVRDGRDVACSYRALNHLNTQSPYKPQLPYSIKEIAQEWSLNILKTGTFLEQLTPDRKLIITYEDLIEHPQKKAKEICLFFGIDFEPAMLNYYITTKEPKAFIEWKRKTLLPPDPSNKNVYLTDLSDKDISDFNQIAGNTLKLYGYTV
jgi:hypothetical protein